MGDRYSDVGYDFTRVGLGVKPAVLVVDFQLAFTDPKYPLGGLPMIHAARDRTAELLQVARACDVPVAACYTAYGSLADMPLWNVKPVREEFFYGHPCTGMDPKIHHERNFTYCKNAPSMFFQTPLITFLAKQRVDTVIVTGCTTSGCVNPVSRTFNELKSLDPRPVCAPRGHASRRWRLGLCAIRFEL